eukprot:gene8435-2312_t
MSSSAKKPVVLRASVTFGQGTPAAGRAQPTIGGRQPSQSSALNGAGQIEHAGPPHKLRHVHTH